MSLEVTTRAVGRWIVVAMDGEVDAYNCGQLSTALDEAGAASAWLVVDCDRLAFCDSSFLAALVHAYKRTAADGGTLVIAAAPRRLRDLLTRTGLDRILVSYPGVGRRGCLDRPSRISAWGTAAWTLSG